jgi:hypothetical protein
MERRLRKNARTTAAGAKIATSREGMSVPARAIRFIQRLTQQSLTH